MPVELQTNPEAAGETPACLLANSSSVRARGIVLPPLVSTQRPPFTRRMPMELQVDARRARQRAMPSCLMQGAGSCPAFDLATDQNGGISFHLPLSPHLIDGAGLWMPVELQRFV